MKNPAPRPALKKAPDSKVHPAAPEMKPARVKAELRTKGTGPQGPGPLRQGATSDHLRPKGKPASGSGKPKEDLVVLEVQLPKKLRKQLKQRAKESNMSTDEAVTRLIEIWLGN